MELHDYQKYAVRFIEEHPIAALFLDMGLGKTITTLTAIHNLMFDFGQKGSDYCTAASCP